MEAKSDFLDGFHGGAGSKPTLRFGRTINGLAGRRGRAPDVGANSNRRRRTACYVSIAGARATEREEGVAVGQSGRRVYVLPLIPP